MSSPRRDVHRADSVVQIGDVPVGGRRFVVIGGPCAVESPRADPRRRTARARRRAPTSCGAGPSSRASSPYAFQGLGEEGLRILAERAPPPAAVVTEALDVGQVDLVEKYADAIQIGSRNMHNFPLLKRAGRAGKPVLLKRGFAATLDELLMAAELRPG